MPRIPDDELNRLKKEIPIVDLIQSSGVTLKQQGKNYIGLCPLHDDKEPSLIVTPETNLWCCKGACNTGGSTIDWVAKSQGASFRLACEILQKDQSIITSGVRPSTRNTTTVLSSPLAANADNQKLLQQVITYYHDVLKESPEALEYLQSRGINDPDLINTFKLGYSNRTLPYRLPEKNRKAGAEIRGQLQEIGILRKSGHEHFNGSIVLPVMDENQQITEVYGRRVSGKKVRKGSPQHL